MKNPFSVKEDRELFERLSEEAALETDPEKKKDLTKQVIAVGKKLILRETLRGVAIGAGVATVISGTFIVAHNVLERDEETEEETETED